MTHTEAHEELVKVTLGCDVAFSHDEYIRYSWKVCFETHWPDYTPGEVQIGWSPKQVRNTRAKQRQACFSFL
jgi:hypothetical protein